MTDDPDLRQKWDKRVVAVGARVVMRIAGKMRLGAVLLGIGAGGHACDPLENPHEIEWV